MNDEITRVARAIAERALISSRHPWPAPNHPDWLDLACAAIDAMTSPNHPPVVEPDDIVERLREYAEEWQLDRSMVDRAADKIIHLRALIEASVVLAQPGALTVNCVRGSITCQEAERLRARVAVLEAALKPFAALPLWPDAAGDLASEFIESETDLAPVARNDIRAARAALEAKPCA